MLTSPLRLFNPATTGLKVCTLSKIIPFRKKDGFGTLEIVIIIAVILSIALLFRSTLTRYATNLIETVFAGDPLAN